MSPPLVSVVIPAYNQAEFLPEAIQSVLDQSYQEFEVLVVNDASNDHTDAVMKGFQDLRLKYIVHKENQGLSAARNTGIKESKGELIFLLDADDFFHHEKIQKHVEYLEKQSGIGISYNARFELNHSAKTIREMWRPPLAVGLRDLVLGFPFSPSDTVVRREWAFRVGLFDPKAGTAEDTDFPCKLALADCQFAGIDRALNYRRYHSGRTRKNLPARLRDVERVQESVFADPRCPQDVRALGRMAIRHHLMVIVSLALIQNETALAQRYVRELVALDPSVLKGNPCELVDFLLSECIADESVNHEDLLKQVFAQMPEELSRLSSQYAWSVARGYLWKGIRAIMWGREMDGEDHIRHALNLHGRFDHALMQRTTYHLLGYEKEFGFGCAMHVIADLSPYVNKVIGCGGNRLKGSFLVNLAFEKYRAKEYKKVPAMVCQAWRLNPSYLINRGVLSIFFRSMLRSVR